MSPVEVPPGGGGALNRDQARELNLARESLKRLGPERAQDFKMVLSTGRVLHKISPTLLPEWKAWAAGHHYFTSAKCAEYWAKFPEFKGEPPSLGLLISWVRADTGDATFGKRGTP